MDNASLFQSLLQLRREEQLAEEFQRITGREAGLEQYLYIRIHPNFQGPAIQLTSPSALIEQDRLLQQFREVLPDHRLIATYALPDSQEIEIEQMERYYRFSPHRHDFFEFVCVLSGECSHTIDGHVFVHPAGDFSIVPPEVWHEHYASPDCVCLTTKVRRERLLSLFHNLISSSSLLSAYFTQVIEMPDFARALTFSGGNDPFIRETMLTMYGQQLGGLPFSSNIIARLWEVLFTYYLQNYQDTVRFLEPYALRNVTSSEILNFIFSNFQTITLKEAARHFYITPAHFSTKLHKLTGKTFTQLLLDYRLARAADLLVHSDRKLMEIVEDVGYHDPSQFARIFKKSCGVTPSQYRRQNRGGTESVSSGLAHYKSARETIP